jgi:hypothetical protein
VGVSFAAILPRLLSLMPWAALCRRSAASYGRPAKLLCLALFIDLRTKNPGTPLGTGAPGLSSCCNAGDRIAGTKFNRLRHSAGGAILRPALFFAANSCLLFEASLLAQSHSLLDLTMMMFTGGGRERTAKQFDLLVSRGFATWTHHPDAHTG